ncbi:Gx transporter family protein [Thermithiobacillus plumbiphilus]|uniref:Gx transporter family protein n=1 Tax=Thermithiobacillus plumbiphilus TaxID=1729899 RepID=A0ABU9D8E8_9PROT
MPSPSEVDGVRAISREDWRIASLTALAVSLHIVESALPPLLPGLKPGLANIVVIVTLCRYGYRDAVWVSLLRVLVSALLLGTLFSPTFWLSLAGALGSLLILWPARWLPGRGFGPLGFSLLAAMAHIGAQFLMAYLVFVQHAGVFWLLPPLLAASLIFGTFNGLIAHWILFQLASRPSGRP